MNLLKLIWRNSSRRSFTYVILFFLGVLSCLFCLQIFHLSNDLNKDYTPYYYSADTDKKAVQKSKETLNHDLFPQSNEYYEEVERHAAEETPTFRGHGPGVNRRGLAWTDNQSEKSDQQLLPGGIEVKGPTVWVVTPTFYRPEQKPELTRLAQALIPVKHFIHWIIVHDTLQGSDRSLKELQIFLERFPLSFTLLKSITPSNKVKVVGKPRGVGGRRAAIAWLRKYATEGVVYFADDDNTYDSDIFRQMQRTKKVTMWPVGLVTSFGVSSPIVKNGQVVGFYDGWNGSRKFPVDMAGFAININMFLGKPNANMPWVAGYEEDQLLKTLGVSMPDIVPLANNCSEILVWHTKTVRNPWPVRPKNLNAEIEASTNLKRLLESLPQKAYAGLSSNTKSVPAPDNFSILKFFFGGH